MFFPDNLGFQFIGELSPFYYLSEVANYLFCLVIVCFFIHFKYVKKEHFLFWAIYFLSPFIFNFLLFDPAYMGDQFLYATQIIQMKNGISTDQITAPFGSFEYFKQARVFVSTYLLSYIPIFSLASITSLAFINKLLIFFMFLFLEKRIPTVIALYLILIPSLVLYSSVSLRDTLVLVAGVISLVYLIERNMLGSFVFIVLVGLTKLQNFPALLVLWVFTFIFDASKSYLRLGTIALLILFCSFIFFDTFSGILNLYRVAWAVEDGMSLKDATGLEFSSAFDLIFLGLIEIPIFLLKPLPWQISNPLQLFVFLENIFLIYLIYLFSIKDGFYKNKENIVLIAGFFMCMGLHAITVYNYGTLARYRFIGFFPYLIAFYYLRNKYVFERKLTTA